MKMSGIDQYTLPGAYGHLGFPFYYIIYIDQLAVTLAPGVSEQSLDGAMSGAGLVVESVSLINRIYVSIMINKGNTCRLRAKHAVLWNPSLYHES